MKYDYLSEEEIEEVRRTESGELHPIRIPRNPSPIADWKIYLQMWQRGLKDFIRRDEQLQS